MTEAVTPSDSRALFPLSTRFRGNTRRYRLLVRASENHSDILVVGVPRTLDDQRFRLFITGIGPITVRFDAVIGFERVTEGEA